MYIWYKIVRTYFFDSKVQFPFPLPFLAPCNKEKRENELSVKQKRHYFSVTNKIIDSPYFVSFSLSTVNISWDRCQIHLLLFVCTVPNSVHWKKYKFWYLFFLILSLETRSGQQLVQSEVNHFLSLSETHRAHAPNFIHHVQMELNVGIENPDFISLLNL